MRHHVSATSRTTEERQDAPLLEHRREQASRRWPSGAAARLLFGRDQLLAGGSLAQGGRGVRPRRRPLPDAGLVPRRSLRGRGGRRFGRATAALRDAAAPATAVGRVLVGRAAVAGPATRSV